MQKLMDRVVPQVAPRLDPALASYLSELVAVGEAEIAVVTLIENAPEAVDQAFVDDIEAHFKNSGEYAEREALRAVKAYRSGRVAD